MRVANSYSKRGAKLSFLKSSWGWRKIAFAFYPITIPAALSVVLVFCLIDCLIDACGEFKNNFGCFWQDALHGSKPFGMREAMYAGWFIWSKQKAADYLFGLTDEELKGEEWPGLPPMHKEK